MTNDQIQKILSFDTEFLLSTLPGVGSRNFSKAKKVSPEWVRVVTVLRHKINSSKRRAKKMNFTHDIDLPYLVKIWIQQKGLCPMTGMIMQFESGSSKDKNHLVCSIDRINSQRGYVQGNVKLCTHWANNCKNTWNESVFVDMIKTSYAFISIPKQLPLF